VAATLYAIASLCHATFACTCWTYIYIYRERSRERLHAHVCNARIRAPVGILFKHSFIISTSSSNHLLNCQVVMNQMQIITCSDTDTLYRPCVDCGRKTGCFCDNCKAKDRVPSEKWADNQQTPLCTDCDRQYYECHFCRGLQWCTPFEPRLKW
jgi:hypothetical protein